MLRNLSAFHMGIYSTSPSTVYTVQMLHFKSANIALQFVNPQILFSKCYKCTTHHCYYVPLEHLPVLSSVRYMR